MPGIRGTAKDCMCECVRTFATCWEGLRAVDQTPAVALHFFNRPFAQILSGLETGHPAAVGPPPAYDFSVFDEQKAVFLVSVLDCSECDSSGLSKLKLEHCSS